MSGRMVDQGDESSGSNEHKNKQSFVSASSDRSDKNFLKDLASLIQEDYHNILPPYRSKFELKSISSRKSRDSRDSDLMNRLDKEKSNSLSRSRNNSSMYLENSFNNSATPKSTGVMSEEETSYRRVLSTKEEKTQTRDTKEAREQVQITIPTPIKIHNCVCFVAQECLAYNCNCFLSPFPCTPECCPNCIILKSNLPTKISNACNCKKTKCLKLYCECLAKGLFCSIMCTCQLCENHAHSKLRKEVEPVIDKSPAYTSKGCSCKKISCDKKYCECYSQNVKCTRSCKCMNCNNGQEPSPMEEESPEAKKSYVLDMPEMAFQPPDLFGERKKRK